MKKLLMLALALSLAACGGGGSDTPDQTPQEKMDATMAKFCSLHGGGYTKGVNQSHPGINTIAYDVRCTDGTYTIFVFDREGQMQG